MDGNGQSQNDATDPLTIVERDREWMSQLRNGDERALEAIMRAYATKLGAISFSLLGRSDLAKDVVQDVFVTLWEQRTTIQIHNTLGGYLARAVRNRALNVSRHERHHERIAERFADGIATFDPSVMLAANNSAEQTLEEADFNAQLLRALQSVPPQPRQVFLLSWHAGLSYPEIAETLGVTVASAYKMMYRATQRLAEILPWGMD